MTAEKYINEYLFYEFTYDLEEDENKISENWPFELTLIGELDFNGKISVYEFVDSNQEFFVLYGKRLSCFEKNGMSIEDLYIQLSGSMWLGEQEIVDIQTTKLGDDRIPPLNERRSRIEYLAKEKAGIETEFKMLEGLYLINRNENIGVIEVSNGTRVILGDNIETIFIEHSDLSTSRCISLEIGKLIKENRIS